VKIALCNEVIREMPFAAQCAYAAALGYDGLEVAPFTLDEHPQLLAPDRRRELRAAAAAAGVTIIGLHWLLATPAGLSITSADSAIRERTLEVMRRLVGLCADLGGGVMVHGSPAQRRLDAATDPAEAWKRARDLFAGVAREAEQAGVTYCIEPLAPRETAFINTVAEAAKLVEEIGRPAIRTMIDTSAAGLAEQMPVAELIDRWLPTGLIAHVQVNDTNRRGPGQGDNRFAPVFAALARHGYDRVVSVEPFDYQPDGAGAAARAIGYIRGIRETLEWEDGAALPERRQRVVPDRR
jgi:sugar phosphate isomerase/epimerase